MKVPAVGEIPRGDFKCGAKRPFFSIGRDVAQGEKHTPGVDGLRGRIRVLHRLSSLRVEHSLIVSSNLVTSPAPYASDMEKS